MFRAIPVFDSRRLEWSSSSRESPLFPSRFLLRSAGLRLGYRVRAHCRPVFGVDPELGARRVRTKRFPYAIVFIELPKTIRVIAIMHERRRPGYWKNRIG